MKQYFKVSTNLLSLRIYSQTHYKLDNKVGTNKENEKRTSFDSLMSQEWQGATALGSNTQLPVMQRMEKMIVWINRCIRTFCGHRTRQILDTPLEFRFQSGTSCSSTQQHRDSGLRVRTLALGSCYRRLDLKKLIWKNMIPVKPS